MAWPVVVACLLLSLSFLPTAIACDFRYLYPAIPLGSVAWTVLLLGGARPTAGNTFRGAPGIG